MRVQFVYLPVALTTPDTGSIIWSKIDFGRPSWDYYHMNMNYMNHIAHESSYNVAAPTMLPRVLTMDLATAYHRRFADHFLHCRRRRCCACKFENGKVFSSRMRAWRIVLRKVAYIGGNKMFTLRMLSGVPTRCRK